MEAIGNADRVALASLVNAGLAQHDAGYRRGGTPTLSADAVFSLAVGVRQLVMPHNGCWVMV